MALPLLVRTGPAAGSFEGRASRGTWFAATGLNALVAAMIFSIPWWGPLLALPWIASMFAVTTRRLHDLEKSGWWQVIPWGVALAVLVGVFWSLGWSLRYSNLDDLLSEAGGYLLLVFTPMCLWLGFARGTIGPNGYGESNE